VAQFNLSYCYGHGKGIDQDDAACLEWQNKAASQVGRVSTKWPPTVAARGPRSVPFHSLYPRLRHACALLDPSRPSVASAVAVRSL
jgi:hypothetical protein